MFCYLFFSLVTAEQSIYDIFDPIKTTSPDEFGYWSMIGVATNMKTSIHFSPDSSKQNGAICSRIPTSSNEWFSQFRVQILKGSIVYVVSDESCPYWSISHSVDSWSGISLNISRRKDGKVIIYANYLNNSQPCVSKLCRVDTESVTIRASYKDNNMTYSVLADGDSKFTGCGGSIPLPNMEKSYFTFFAQNSDGIGNSELYHYILKIPATYNETLNLSLLDEFNRRHILMQQDKRSSNHPILPLSTKIIEEMEKVSYRLDKASSENTAQNIRDLLLEVRGRLNKSLTADDLQKLVHATIAMSLMRAEKKMEKRRMAFIGIRDDLNNLKLVVDEKLKWLSQFVVNSMEEAKGGAVNTLTEFLNLTIESEKLPKEAKMRAKEIRSQWTPTFLYLISFIELVCYLAFFFVKRQKTNGFKKLD